MFKTVNSVAISDSWFTESFESLSYFTEPEEDPVETVIRGLRSERLFFEPEETSSILEEAKTSEFIPFKESVVMAMESRDPYADFLRSMEEMVEAHGLKDWECLEELLGCYLRVNGKDNHGYIIGAFVDLLIAIALGSFSFTSSSSSPFSFSYSSSSSSSSCTTTTTTITASVTPCLSSLESEGQTD